MVYLRILEKKSRTNYIKTRRQKFFRSGHKVINQKLNKKNNYYELYRVDKNNIDIYKFIGVVPTKLIYTKDNYIYYEHNNKLYFYSDALGTRTLLEDSELSFNNTIKYYIY